MSDGKTPRTLVLLSHKRSGTTALFKTFQQHPEASVCHVDQTIRIWKPNFWNLAADAIDGASAAFEERFSQSHPFLRFPDAYTEEAVFALWDHIVEELGPIVFDKSPQYLGNRKALALLLQYREQPRDVRLFALVRNPFDTISSQFERLGKGSFRKKGRRRTSEILGAFPDLEADGPAKREQHWLMKHAHLRELLADGEDIPVFRYEDIMAAPGVYLPTIFRHCGLDDCPEAYAALRPTNVGRHGKSENRQFCAWQPGRELRTTAEVMGYRYERPHRFRNLLRSRLGVWTGSTP
ncbi:MAG: sulfotransferase [Alphaproteobacteria bacterium]|nr:sulfotransferase [Alphaproteobacteria bacterium]